MSDIEEMLTRAVEGVTRQFNAQVEASIAMLVNSGIPLERIEFINRTTDDMSVVTEVRSRTSDEDQAVAIERNMTATWLDKLGDDEMWADIATRYHLAAEAVRNGEHVKEEA